MYVRLAFAVAAHLEPEILIVDEVLAVGDAEFQKKCLGKMHDVSITDGRTVIFVSHNMTAVEGLCDRVLLVEAGKLCLDSEPRRVVQTYLNKSSASAAQQLSVGALPRQGSGDARFTAFHVENAEGDHVKFVQSGQRIRLVFAYACKSSILGLALNVGFGIHGEDDLCLFVIYASQLGRELKSLRLAAIRLHSSAPSIKSWQILGSSAN